MTRENMWPWGNCTYFSTRLDVILWNSFSLLQILPVRLSPDYNHEKAPKGTNNAVFEEIKLEQSIT